MERQLSVALLLSDLNEVKEISSVFKKMGIIPHFYEDLKTFWEGTAERVPSLSIVDVKNMSDGKLVLADHPRVKSEEMNLVFWYTPNTEPLLVSTNEFFHLGLLKKTSHYEASLKAILKRLNHLIKIEFENEFLQAEKAKNLEEIEKLKLENLTAQKTDQYQSMVKRVCVEFEELRGEADFLRAVEKVFQGIDEVSEFAMMELSFNGQKLMSPLSHVQKFRTIPSLWLGQACINGIELFAQNMATQVAVDIMGGELVSLLIKGDNGKPDKIMFIKSKNDLFYNEFDWNMLEAYLNGFYATIRNKMNKEIVSTKKFTSSFEAMSFLDQFLFGSTSAIGTELKNAKKGDYRLVDLDLSVLIEMVMKKGNNRFFWHKFEKDFVNKLEIQTRTEFRVFDFGVTHLGFLVEARDLDAFYEELRDFALKFSYWKYFEENEGVLSQIIRPKVSMVPLSAYAYLKAVSTKEENEAEKSAKAKIKTKELIWGKEPLHEI